MRNYCHALWLVLVWPFCAIGQKNTIALPEIINYGSLDYNGGTQNWRIAQDERGIIYVANNKGLLSYDGSRWKKYKLPNETIVRSVAVGEDGNIYVGGQSEIGYFSANKQGVLEYHSLTGLIPTNQREFADVWNVVALKDQVFYHSNKKIFLYNNGKMVVYPSVHWDHLGYSNGMILANEYEKGLLQFKNGLWVPFIEQPVFPARTRVVDFISLNNDTVLLATKKDGIYYLSHNKLTRFNSPDLQQLSDKNVGGIVKLNNDKLAIATNLAGCFIVDRQGKLEQHISKQEGLQYNNVISLFVDRRKNLWLALDNGVDFIAYNNAIRHFFPDKQEHATGYSAYLYKNNLYLAMATGLYRAPVESTTDLSTVQSSFSLLKNTKGQLWNLSEVNGQLLMGHNDGAYQVQGDQVSLIDGSTGFWFFMPISSIQPSATIVAGTYNGLNFYTYENGRFINKGIKSHFESARYVSIENNIAWVAHPYLGLYKVQLDNGVNPTYKVYADQKHIISSNHNFIFKIKSRTILSTDKGLFEYDAKTDDFVPCIFLRKIFGNTSIQYLKEDDKGNIWFIQNQKLGVVDMGGKEPVIVYIPELNQKLLTNGFDFIYPYNSKNVFVAGDQGFYLINYEQYKTITGTTPLLITSVKATSDHDSCLYAGYTRQVNADDIMVNSQLSRLPNKWNTLHFEFSAPLFGKQASVEYAYMLEDFDKGWSAWSSKTEKEYTYLPPGKYTFKVQARSHPGDTPQMRSYQFEVLPPWYLSRLAWIAYASLLVFGVFTFGRIQKRKFAQQQFKYEEENKKLQYLHQLELEKSESEIIKLRNEKLEAELQLKNKELATTTINLVQKGEVLHKVKDEFMRMKKTGTEAENPEDLKKLIKMLEPEKVKKDWEQFALHFNQVHDDFLIAIKREYPTLTSTEIKLCAYLRMNISSKEIAHIMNITVKSVELSRYRLRKKLQLAPEANLFNFLLEFHSKKNGGTPEDLNRQG
ncbi:MAG TPA: triple tyrosine motif-containing protein [Phnomibacter sp.]|nr:triple tyrosine motif-containing protein [Phnomibacter sp.]